MVNNVMERRWIPGSGAVDNLYGTAFVGEGWAHTFRITGWDGERVVPISGEITANFLAGNDVLIPLNGSLENGAAVVTLSSACYQVAGRFVLSIYATENGRTVCVYCGVGNVMNTSSDSVYDPDDIVPSLQELLAQIAAMTEGTARANAAAAALEDMAVAAHAASGQTPTAEVTEEDGHYKVDFGLVPATISQQATDYQVSQSGTTVPTGTWVSTLPSCPQGQFLWTRTQILWNGGQVSTVYSVSRQGIDGSGAVSTVNGVSPDANGEVTLPVDSAPTANSSHLVTSGGVKSAIGAVESRVTAAEGNITGLGTRMGAAETNITTLQGQAASHDTGLADHGTRLANIESQLPALPKTEDITSLLSVAVSSGSIALAGDCYAYRCGDVVMLYISVKATAAISAGSVIGILQVSGIPLPPVQVFGSTYSSTRVEVGQLYPDGTLYVRNTVASMPSGNVANISFTYLAAPETEE